MKQRFLWLVFLCGLLGIAQAATLPLYQNQVPTLNPAIDATAVENTSSLTGSSVNGLPYSTANTLFFTNQASGSMSGNVGFRFEFLTNSFRYPMDTFVNRGLIVANTNLFINATNITNYSLMSVGPDGAIKLKGSNVTAVRGRFSAGVSGSFEHDPGLPGNRYVNPPGVRDLYFSVGVNGDNDPDNNNLPQDMSVNTFALPFPTTMIHDQVWFDNSLPFLVTNFGRLPFYSANFKADVFQSQQGTNILLNVVFTPITTDPLIRTDVRFGFANRKEAVIGFLAADTNVATGELIDDAVYLTDRTGNFNTNGAVPQTNSVFSTFRPSAYQVERSTPVNWDFLQSANTIYDSTLLSSPPFRSNRVTVLHSAYGVQIGGYTFNGTQSFNPTNSPGRVEFEGDKLNLDLARVRAESYIAFRSTNFQGNSNAVFDAPFIDYQLVSTNQTVTVDNMVRDTSTRITGRILAWSAFWTNEIVVTTVIGTNVTFRTNLAQVALTFVDHNLTSVQPVQVGRFSIKGDNVSVGDPINPQVQTLVDSQTLTIQPNGTLIMPGSAGVAQFPRLKCLTNFGVLSASSLLQFGNDTPEPFSNIFNHGFMSGSSVQLRTLLLNNGGIINGLIGPVIARFDTGIITNSSFAALSAVGNVEMHGRDLLVTNSALAPSAALVFDITNSLTDGGANSSNLFSCGDGFQFLVKPATGSLLGTTIRSSLGLFGTTSHLTAGANRGAVASGFVDNIAVGRLVLDGADNSLFVFSGVGVSNAIYVDYLELDNFATNYQTALQIDANVTVYFADSNIPAEKLDGAHGGRLRWISSYAGAFSSTNVALTGGGFITVNRALRDSSAIDSDADGIPNKFDTFPFDPPFVLMTLTAIPPSAVNAVPNTALISWQAAANTTYRIECRQTVNGPWSFLTNYTHGAKKGTATIADPLNTNGACFYRVLYFR